MSKCKREHEFLSLTRELLDSDQVRMMGRWRHHGPVTTLDHSLFVAFSSYRLARFLGLDTRAAARGGLLHDLFLYDWHKPNPYPGLHGFTHPKIALHNARKFFSISDLEADIIRTHMWPLTFWAFPHHWESLVVSCADKLRAVCETFGLVRRARNTRTLGWIAGLCMSWA